MVALTFDDGPSGRTPAILRVLANHHAHATFFVVGRSTRGMEPVLRHIAATGNELADHTYSHADLLALREPAQRRQLQWTRGLVARATGVQPRFFRPPYGATGPAVNRLGRSLGLIPVLWSVDSRDWQLPGTKAIVRRVLANVRAGSIVLLHDGGGDRQETLRALPAILRALQRRHLKVVTLSRLLRERAAGERVLERLLRRGRRAPVGGLELVSKVAFVVGGLEASGSGSRLEDPVGTHSRAGIRSREAPWLARLFARAKGRRRSGCRATPSSHQKSLRPTTRPQAIRDLRTPRHF